MGGRGGGGGTQYVQAGTPMGAPARTADETGYLAEQKAQMDQMKTAYESQLAALNKQYADAQQQSKSVLAQLQASSEQQRATADQNRAEMAAASESSQKQLTMLAASRDQAVGMSREAQSNQLNQTGEMYDRLTRRRQARRIAY
jgi:esterase/lipase